jgi:hypothetical protein
MCLRSGPFILSDIWIESLRWSLRCFPFDP